MFSQEQAQFQIFKQPGIRQAPAAPSGVLVPGEAGWNVKHARSKLDNPQVQGDGFKREFALGNHTTTGGGSLVYNLNYLGHLLNALCDGLTSAAFSGVLSVAVTNGGSGYTSTPTVEFTGAGTGAAAVAIVVGGSVVGVVVTNPGTGYATAPTVAFTGGAGTGAAATATVDATKFKHVGTISSGSPFYHLVEKGIVGEALFRRYFDMVLKKLSFTDTVEGICTVTDEWIGSGEMQTNAASLDATPAEVTGTPGEYANLVLLEGGAASGLLIDLSIDVDCSIVEKRPPLAIAGKATELRRGGWTVTGSGRAYFDDETLATKMLNGTLTSLMSVVTSPDGSFSKRMPEAKYESSDWERSDEGLLIPFNYESIKKSDAASPIEFVLINGTATYPA